MSRLSFFNVLISLFPEHFFLQSFKICRHFLALVASFFIAAYSSCVFIIFSCSFKQSYVRPVSRSGLLKGREVCRLWKWEGDAEGGQPGFAENAREGAAGELYLRQSQQGFFPCPVSVQLSPPFQKYPCGPELAPNLVCFSFRSIILGGPPRHAAHFLPSRQKPRRPASLCVREVA